MDIGTKTRCFRKSKRFDLLSGQWEEKRFQQHRQRVENAAPRIDVQKPMSANFQHVKVKAKKLQREEERDYEVMVNNMILLRHLTEIAASKRVDDRNGRKKASNWEDLYDNILMLRRHQLENFWRENTAEDTEGNVGDQPNVVKEATSTSGEGTVGQDSKASKKS